MAMNLAIFLTSLLLLPPLSLSFSPENTSTNQRILVLLDDRLIKSSHSLYFKSLQNHGYNLDFKLSTDPKISIHRHGQYLYDGLILFSPSVKKFGGTLDFTSVLEFVDSGHNLILVVDRYASDLIRNIATVFRVDLDEDSSAVVIDHIHYAVSDIEGDHTLLAIDGFNRSDVILGTQMIKAPVLFKGIGHVLNPFNSQVLKVLSASSSAYSANPDTELSNRPSLSGSRISLVSVVQARINARVLISGSLDLFSNRLFRSSVQKSGTLTKYPKSGNEQFTFELSKWVLHDRREDDLRRCTILLKSECDDREKQTSLEKQSLCERRKLFRLDEEVQLSQRERYINGRQQELSQLEKTLEESKAKIETELKIMNKDKTDLKLKLDALSTRMEAVCKKEAMLDKKEAELLFTQEKLARREHDEIQKLVAKLQASLEVKKFESEEIEHRRIAMQNEMNTKRRACELKELDLRQSEEFLQEKEMEFDVSLEKNKEERNSAALVSTKKGFFDHLKDAAELATETIILSKGCCATEPCPFDEYVRCKERISRHMEKLAALPYVFYIPYGLLLYIPHVLRHPLPQRE